MSDFIEDFYYGNIEPQECTTSLTAKVKKSLSELTGKEEHLTSLLVDKEQELFTDYVATYIKFSSLCNAGSYQGLIYKTTKSVARKGNRFFVLRYKSLSGFAIFSFGKRYVFYTRYVLLKQQRLFE